MPKDIFRFVEHREKATYGLGYKLPLPKNRDQAVSVKTAGVADARIITDHIHLYVPHYTLSSSQQGILSGQFLIKTPMELRYFEKSVFIREVINQKLWDFELGG